MDESSWEYGINLTYMKESSDYWLNTFSWRKVEEKINSYPNFILTLMVILFISYIYNENSKNPMVFFKNNYINVPVTYAQVSKELSKPPREFLSEAYNIQRWRVMEKG